MGVYILALCYWVSVGGWRRRGGRHISIIHTHVLGVFSIRGLLYGYCVIRVTHVVRDVRTTTVWGDTYASGDDGWYRFYWDLSIWCEQHQQAGQPAGVRVNRCRRPLPQTARIYVSLPTPTTDIIE